MLPISDTSLLQADCDEVQGALASLSFAVALVVDAAGDGDARLQRSARHATIALADALTIAAGRPSHEALGAKPAPWSSSSSAMRNACRWRTARARRSAPCAASSRRTTTSRGLPSAAEPPLRGVCERAGNGAQPQPRRFGELSQQFSGTISAVAIPTKHRVLVVDDERAIRDVVEIALDPGRLRRLDRARRRRCPDDRARLGPRVHPARRHDAEDRRPLADPAAPPPDGGPDRHAHRARRRARPRRGPAKPARTTTLPNRSTSRELVARVNTVLRRPTLRTRQPPALRGPRGRPRPARRAARRRARSTSRRVSSICSRR